MSTNIDIYNAFYSKYIVNNISLLLREFNNYNLYRKF